MNRHWTGGQYSLFRGLLGAYSICHVIASLWQEWAASQPGLAFGLVIGLLLLLTILAGLMLTIGVIDRAAALVLAAIHSWQHADLLFAMTPGEIAITLLLLIHVAMPKAPYGSWTARARADPENGWRMPEWLTLSIWNTLMMIVAFCLGMSLPSIGWPLAGLVLPLLWYGRDWFLTSAATLAFLIGLALFGYLPGPLLPVVLFLLLASNPAWIPASRLPSTATLFFDGNCALCHGAVRFLLAEDQRERFSFSPIGGERFTQTLSAGAIANLPDSMLLATDHGEVLLKSDAVITSLHLLGGLWRLPASAFSVLPKSFRDAMYDLIGSRRYALFGKKADSCPLMTAEQRRRFQH